jgi:hypothetical protein
MSKDYEKFEMCQITDEDGLCDNAYFWAESKYKESEKQARADERKKVVDEMIERISNLRDKHVSNRLILEDFQDCLKWINLKHNSKEREG